MLTLDLNKLSLQDSDPIKKEDGLKIKVSVKKNHCVCDRFPYVTTEYFVRFGEGVSWELELLESAIDTGIIKSSGAWLTEINTETGEVDQDSEGNSYRWNGKNAFRSYLLSHPEYRIRLESLVEKGFKVYALSEEEVTSLQKEELLLQSDFEKLQEDCDIKPKKMKKSK